MAQPPYPNPTLQAKIGSSTAEVNLRDWLNTRLAPFLKRAITESLDSEAQYPLQWLGEHLIQQSILFEENPDSTKIKERFLYNHDNATKPYHGQESRNAAVQSPSSLTAQNTLDQSHGTPAPVSQQTPQATMQSEVSAQPVPGGEVASSQGPTPEHSSTSGVNGTMQAEQISLAAPTQDAEMSNAP